MVTLQDIIHIIYIQKYVKQDDRHYHRKLLLSGSLLNGDTSGF